jgi:hypothetical protein
MVQSSGYTVHELKYCTVCCSKKLDLLFYKCSFFLVTWITAFLSLPYIHTHARTHTHSVHTYTHTRTLTHTHTLKSVPCFFALCISEINFNKWKVSIEKEFILGKETRNKLALILLLCLKTLYEAVSERRPSFGKNKMKLLLLLGQGITVMLSENSVSLTAAFSVRVKHYALFSVIGRAWNYC